MLWGEPHAEVWKGGGVGGGRVTGNFAKGSQEKAFVLQDVFYCLFLMSTMGGGGGRGVQVSTDVFFKQIVCDMCDLFLCE